MFSEFWHSSVKEFAKKHAIITCRQLFALYETLPEPSVKKMEEVVNTGINIVASVYFLVCHNFKINEWYLFLVTMYQGFFKMALKAEPLQ